MNGRQLIQYNKASVEIKRIFWHSHCLQYDRSIYQPDWTPANNTKEEIKSSASKRRLDGSPLRFFPYEFAGSGRERRKLRANFANLRWNFASVQMLKSLSISWKYINTRWFDAMERKSKSHDGSTTLRCRGRSEVAQRSLRQKQVPL